MSAHLVAEIAGRLALRRSGNRYTGRCPECGGGGESNRFLFWDNGIYKCFACDLKGDLVKWLRTREGMGCADAHDAAGVTCTASSCPHRATCRLGDGLPRRAVRSVSAPPVAARANVATVAGDGPADRWQQWARAMVSRSAAALAHEPGQIAWLAARGIDAAQVDRSRLGWIGRDSRVVRADLGLSTTDSRGRDRLWLPAGLLIPTFDAQGRVHRLRIRRDEAARARLAPDLKYYQVEGSGRAPMVLEPSAPARGAVLVEAELDAIACAGSHPDILAVSVQSASGRITPELAARLVALPKVLVALDAKPGDPGLKAAGGWLAEYRHAEYWPVPQGKDPGDYAQAGGDLRAWLEAGLVPALPAAGHDPRSSLADQSRGDGGSAAMDTPVPDAFTRSIIDRRGRTVFLVDNPDDWQTVADAGELVCSYGEMGRIQAATVGMTADERAEAAGAVLDVKEVFGAAYVCAGRGGRGGV